MHNWPQLAAACSLRRYLRRCLVGRLLPDSAAGFRQPLLNLTPQERVGFRIPEMDVPVTFFLKKSGHETVQAVIDTLLIDTDALQVQLTWRVSARRNMYYDAARNVHGPSWMLITSGPIDRRFLRKAPASEMPRTCVLTAPETGSRKFLKNCQSHIWTRSNHGIIQALFH